MERKFNHKWVHRPIKARTKMISFRVTLDELKDLEIEATRRRVNISDLMRLALERLFGDGAGR